jgi:WD40 repeat protein
MAMISTKHQHSPPGLLPPATLKMMENPFWGAVHYLEGRNMQRKILFMLLVVLLGFAAFTSVLLSRGVIKRPRICNNAGPVTTNSTGVAITSSTITLENVGSLSLSNQVNLNQNVRDLVIGKDNRILIAINEGVFEWLPSRNTAPLQIFSLNEEGSIAKISPTENSLIMIEDASLSSLNIVSQQEELKIGTQDIGIIVLSPDGERIAYGSASQIIEVSDIQNRYHTTIQARNLPTALEFHPTNNILAYGTHGDNDSLGDIVVAVIDLDTEREIESFIGHTSAVSAIAFKPNSTVFASSGLDSKVFFWDICAKKQIMIFEETNAPIRDIAFSLDGSLLVTADERGYAKFWDTATGELVNSILTDGGALMSIDFNDNGSLLATYSAEGSVYVFALDN